MGIFKPRPKQFERGTLVVTDDVVDLMANSNEFCAFVYASFIRYVANDWGDLDNQTKKLNRRNIKHGGNIGGRYLDEEHGWRIMIITSESRDRTIISIGG